MVKVVQYILTILYSICTFHIKLVKCCIQIFITCRVMHFFLTNYKIVMELLERRKPTFPKNFKPQYLGKYFT